MADQEYHRRYWQDYKKRKRRFTLTLTSKEYQQWQQAAKKRGPNISIAQQIKDEAQAYHNQEHNG